MDQPTRPYRLFDIVLLRRQLLSPALSRFTFGGPQVSQMKTLAADQRVKLFFPDPQGRPPALADAPDWYARWKAEDPDARPPMRTYTIRSLRAEAGEVDVDFVLHGENGPASAWATHSKPGEQLQMTAPNALHAGDTGGYEWKPPAGLKSLLLIADETALPAAAGILEELATLSAPPQTQLFIEVPSIADRIKLASWSGLAVQWMARGHGAPGDLMVEAAARARVAAAAGAETALADIDVDRVILWDRAEPQTNGFYGWVAGEAAAVRAIRRHLIQERGVDRKALNLMGYWREGRVLD